MLLSSQDRLWDMQKVLKAFFFCHSIKKFSIQSETTQLRIFFPLFDGHCFSASKNGTLILPWESLYFYWYTLEWCVPQRATNGNTPPLKLCSVLKILNSIVQLASLQWPCCVTSFLKFMNDTFSYEDWICFCTCVMKQTTIGFSFPVVSFRNHNSHKCKGDTGTVLVASFETETWRTNNSSYLVACLLEWRLPCPLERDINNFKTDRYQISCSQIALLPIHSQRKAHSCSSINK